MFWTHLFPKFCARFFGREFKELSVDIRILISKFDSKYRDLSGREINDVVLKILKKIDSSNLVAGVSYKEKWISGWGENLDNFIKSNYDIRELVPKYIRPNHPVRLLGDYVMPRDPEFELHFYEIYRLWLFRKYLSEVHSVYEFGCGTAFNLVELAKLYPEKTLHGLEWVDPPREIIKLLHERCGYNITGHFFDMFNPNEDIQVEDNSAFLAIGSLEQLGADFEPFLQFVLRKKPAIFVHVDSITELYDENNLSDYLALKHDLKRNFLRKYLTRLRELEKEGRVEIMKVQKVPCGGLYHDGYSHIIWRPIGG